MQIITQLQRRIGPKSEPKAQGAADRARVIAGILAEIVFGDVKIGAGAKVAAQEARLGEGDADLLAQGTDRGFGAQVLPTTAEVAFGDAEIQHQTVDRAIASAERQLAGGLFGDLDLQAGAVRRAAGNLSDIDVLKEAQGLDLALGPVDQHAVIGVAFRDQQLAADHRIQGARIADDVDAVDIDARAFLDVEGQVHRTGLAVGRIVGLDVDESEAGGACGEGQGVGGVLDLLVFIKLPFVDWQQLLQHCPIQLF